MDLPPPVLLLMLRHAPIATPPRTLTLKAPRSRIVYDFPTDTLVQYMHLRQDEAAKALGVATITLKRICHRRRIRWPYRAFKAHQQRQQRARNDGANTSHDDANKPQTAALPSYCVYTRPVSKDVPALKPQAACAQPSKARPTLPSLSETLGSFARAQLPALQRPHVRVCVDGQPLAEPAPTLPRLHVAKMTSSIFQTPTTKSPKKEGAPVLSPPALRFRLLPPADLGRLVSRAITHR